MGDKELEKFPPQEEVDETTDARIMRENKDMSTAPGMTVFVTPEVADTMRDHANQNGFDPLVVHPVIDGVVGVHYEDGFFSTLATYGEGRGVSIYQHAGSGNTQQEIYFGSTNKVTLGFGAVIAIEDQDGIAWQNRYYPQLGERIKAARPHQAPNLQQ